MIYENISRLCKKKGISIWALERVLGFGNGVIGKWKFCVPRLDMIKSVANYFDVTVDELLSPVTEVAE